MDLYSYLILIIIILQNGLLTLQSSEKCDPFTLMRYKYFVYSPKYRCLPIGYKYEHLDQRAEIFTKWTIPKYTKIPLFAAKSLQNTVTYIDAYNSEEISKDFVMNLNDDSEYDAWYKNPLIQIWSHLSIYSASLVMKKQGQMVSELTFDARRSINKSSWFTQERLIASFPWNLSVIKGEYFESFSLDGVTGSRHRTFYAGSHGGCHVVAGLTLVEENKDLCFEPNGGYPPDKSFSWAYDPNTGGKGLRRIHSNLADVMHINIELDEELVLFYKK